MFEGIRKRTAAAASLTRKEIRNGKSLASIFERSAAALTLMPSVGRGTDSTTVRLTGRTKCEVDEGPWQFSADAGPEVGGTPNRPDPGSLLRAALGTCFVQTAALWAAKRDVSLDRLEVAVETDHDARGLFGVDDAAPRFTEIRYRITAESSAPKKELLNVLNAARAHSPVHDSLEHAFRVKQEVRIDRPTSS